ncbi:MAG TPA: WecB/TagA/CpsF family glycosyltransferase [Acidobacteriota bacterium]|nr:WecB/TagA/CpsF family glycosyltransferase [Acidobacteriota bacterium]
MKYERGFPGLSQMLARAKLISSFNSPNSMEQAIFSSYLPALRPPAIFGSVRVDNVTQSETLDLIESFIRSGEHHRMVVVNASKLVLAEQDLKLREILVTSDIITADGMSVVWASRCSRNFGAGLVERVTGIDTMIELSQRAAQKGYRIFLLGAAPGVAQAAAQQLQTDFPGVHIVGCQDGYFPDSESVHIASMIRASRSDILFVAMGSPKQEHWLATYGAQTGAAFCIGVGGSFDHIAGRVQRAPRWMQKAGLEWLFRFAQEPRRLWRRYLIGNAEFVSFLIRLIRASRSTSSRM